VLVAQEGQMILLVQMVLLVPTLYFLRLLPQAVVKA
jgi:hypothetical protein